MSSSSPWPVLKNRAAVSKFSLLSMRRHSLICQSIICLVLCLPGSLSAADAGGFKDKIPADFYKYVNPDRIGDYQFESLKQIAWGIKNLSRKREFPWGYTYAEGGRPRGVLGDHVFDNVDVEYGFNMRLENKQPPFKVAKLVNALKEHGVEPEYIAGNNNFARFKWVSKGDFKSEEKPDNYKKVDEGRNRGASYKHSCTVTYRVSDEKPKFAMQAKCYYRMDIKKFYSPG